MNLPGDPEIVLPHPGDVFMQLGVRLVRTIDVRNFNVVITVILLAVSVALISQGIVGYSEFAGVGRPT